MEDLKEQVKDHELRLRDLESNHIKLGDNVANLCDKLDSLIAVLKWVGITFSGAFLSIIIYLIEMHFK